MRNVYIFFCKGMNLGNWLFQIAAARELANGGKIYYVCDHEGQKRLERYKILYSDIGFVTAAPKGIQRICYLNLDFKPLPDIPENADVYLDGLFQSFGYFSAEKARHEFSCPETIRRYLFAKYADVLAHPMTVGVSVRRGDYMGIPHQLPFVGVRYLSRSICEFAERALYVICSDDIAWCKRFFTAERFPHRSFVFIEGEGVLEQLFVHTFCTHNIISNSTFSWWGAFLNQNYARSERRVIFPSRWFGLGIHARGRELYWEGVEVVDNNKYDWNQWLLAWFMIFRSHVGGLLRKMKLLR